MKNIKILVVDDESMLCDFARTVLEERGFNVITAYSGDDGMRKLEANPDIEVILADVNCAEGNGMDGIDLARKVRELDKLREHATPIVFMSGRIAPHRPSELDALSAFQIAKPFNREDLAGTIRAAYIAANTTPAPLETLKTA